MNKCPRCERFEAALAAHKKAHEEYANTAFGSRQDKYKAFDQILDSDFLGKAKEACTERCTCFEVL